MNLSQIKSDVYFLSRTTSASYPTTDLIRNLNIAYQDVTRLIWESSDGWQYDDANATTLPIAKASLVHLQQDYSLPATTQRLHSVAVKDSNGNYSKLKPIDWSDMTLPPIEFLKTPGLPLYYDPVGRSIMLYPPPVSSSVTLTSGLAVYVERDVTEFKTTATTTVPGFATPFHRILSYAASLDFTQDPSDRNILIAQKARMENGLTRFYSKRAVEQQTQIKPAGKKRWRQYT